MKKVLGIAVVMFAVACSSPENQTDATSDSMNSTNENGVTNSPPGGSTDTSGSFGTDSGRMGTGTDTGGGTSGSGGTSGGGTPAGGTSGTGTSGSASGSTGSGSRTGSDTTRR